MKRPRTLNPLIDLRLPVGPMAPGNARRALDELTDVVSDDRLDEIRLLVSELVTNSVQHAHVSADDSIVLTVSFSEETVRCEVRDGGPGFEPPATPPPEDADAVFDSVGQALLADAEKHATGLRVREQFPVRLRRSAACG